MIPANKSRLFVAWFSRQVEKRIKKTFCAVRVAGLANLTAALEQGPVLVISNHSSWWDPMFAIYLTYRVLRTDGFALMEARNLRRLPFLGRVGGFGVDLEDPKDRAKAIPYTASLLNGPGRLVWIYPQGRERPLFEGINGFKPGAAKIARLVGKPVVVPLALCYPFGAKEKPEALLSFGAPLEVIEDIDAGVRAQEAAVNKEMTSIERYMSARDKDEGFQSLVRSKPSWLARIAERLLALLTRYGRK